MTKYQYVGDKFSIVLSVLCSIHCAAIPVIFAVMPSLSILNLDDEIFHISMVIIMVPISTYTITLGYLSHKNGLTLVIVIVGILLVILAAVLEDSVKGTIGEVVLTLLGAIFLTYGHYRNIEFQYRCTKYN